MTSTYSLPHLRFEGFRSGHSYQRPQKDLSAVSSGRDATHGSRLREKFGLAFQAAAGQNRYFDAEISETAEALCFEVVLAEDAPVPDLNWKMKDIRLSALRMTEDGEIVGALYVPKDSIEFLDIKLQEYTEQKSASGKPKNEKKFSPIESFSLGDVETLWTDSRAFPRGMTTSLWWECWCIPARTERVRRIAHKLKLRVNENSLIFPDTEVLMIYATTFEITILVGNSDGIEELRKATDSPYFFTRLAPSEKSDWVSDLASRIIPPALDCPAVCILDNGVNHAHPFLNIALSNGDCHAINPAWGIDDHDGHGTNMAGTALFGDLTFALTDQRIVELSARLESVKFIPPPGMNRNDPSSYGVITQAAVSLAETNAPMRNRVFCMAVSNDDVSGERPTTWSSAIDQICSGSMLGDLDDEGLPGPRRLFILSAGNIPDSDFPLEASEIGEFPIEDPGQAWNALAVGGFTDKTDLHDAPGYEGWSALAQVGDHSPYSRPSIDWEHSRSPMKPEIVFEAGNKALSPDGRQIISGLPALSGLTTSRDFIKKPFEEFWATSSATAQAAGLAAAIMAKFPSFWPETIRALMIHSAQWTPAMLRRLKGKTKKERIALARHFGYGVPQLQRALSSAQNDLALISEAHIQPFKKETNEYGKEVRFFTESRET